MSKQKTLVILSPGFPKSEEDSTCLPLQQCLVKAIAELYPFLKVVVLAFQYPYHKIPYQWKGISVVPFDGRNRGGLTRWRLRREIKSLLERMNDSVAIVGLLSFWSNECSWIGKKFGDANGITHRCWVLGQDAKKENTYAKKLHFTPAELIALSDFIQREFEKNHGVRPGQVIQPGIDDKLFHENMEKDIDILAAGSLIPLKQYDIFLNVMSTIRGQRPSVKAMLVGKGPEQKNLELLTKQLNLESTVILTGELPYEKLLHLMQRAKLFLHPSMYEGFGCVCEEALYAGAHVISFCKPMDSAISHWHIVKDRNEMVKKALSLLNDASTEYSRSKISLIVETAAAFMKAFQLDQ